MEHFVHPGRVLIAGKSKSGKTTLAVKIILKKYSPKVNRIMFLCPTYHQPAFDPVRHLLKEKRDVFNTDDENAIKVIEKQLQEQRNICDKMGLPPVETLLFIDDMAGKKMMHGNRHSPFANLSLHCNHLHLSIIVLTQQPMGITPSFRENIDCLICYPSLKRTDREWLYNEYNCMMKKKTFIKLVKQAWKGPGNTEYSEFGEHFLFIVFPVRAAPRYFIDFSHELSTRNPKQQIDNE
jgi:GTPase SAR1 family protein